RPDGRPPVVSALVEVRLPRARHPAGDVAGLVGVADAERLAVGRLEPRDRGDLDARKERSALTHLKAGPRQRGRLLGRQDRVEAGRRLWWGTGPVVDKVAVLPAQEIVVLAGAQREPGGRIAVGDVALVTGHRRHEHQARLVNRILAGGIERGEMRRL